MISCSLISLFCAKTISGRYSTSFKNVLICLGLAYSADEKAFLCLVWNLLGAGVIIVYNGIAGIIIFSILKVTLVFLYSNIEYRRTFFVNIYKWDFFSYTLFNFIYLISRFKNDNIFCFLDKSLKRNLKLTVSLKLLLVDFKLKSKE